MIRSNRKIDYVGTTQSRPADGCWLAMGFEIIYRIHPESTVSILPPHPEPTGFIQRYTDAGTSYCCNNRFATQISLINQCWNLALLKTGITQLTVTSSAPCPYTSMRVNCQTMAGPR